MLCFLQDTGGSGSFVVRSINWRQNEDIEEAVKSALQKSERYGIGDLGMKDLLVQSKSWDEVSFSDVGDVGENDGEGLVEENDHD